MKGVPLIQHLPRLKLFHNDAAMNLTSLLSPPSQWVSAGCRLPFFGLCSHGQELAATMQCYTFESIGPHHNSQLRRFDPLPAGVHSLPSSIIDSEFLRDLRFCDRYLVIAWLDGSASYANISLMPTPVDPNKEVSSETHDRNLKFNSDHSEDIVINDFDFCPASGRLVVTTDSGDIRIMDYLCPPMSGSPSASTPFAIRTISDVSSLIAINDH